MGDTFDCHFYTQSWGIPENVNTFPKMLHQMALTYPKRRLLGTREYLTNGTRGAYEWYSYQDVHNLAAMFAEGLKQLGFKRGDKAGIISANRTEWTVVDFACSSIGMILVPIYDSQSIDDIKYVCENAELKVIFAALDKLERI